MWKTSVLLRQGLHQFIHFFERVVKVRRNSQSITAGSSDDVSFPEVAVQIHWTETSSVSNTNDLRFFAHASRAYNFIVRVSQLFAKVVGEFFEMRLDGANANLIQKLQARF